MKLYLPTAFLALTLLIISCNKDEDIPPPQQTVTNAELSGLLGGIITIKGENLEIDKLQVFFDLEKAQIHYISPKLIEVIIPRGIKRYNPIIRVINLKTNEDILKEPFVLKSPIIKGFGNEQITFDEKLIINGENFDNNKDHLEVFINDEKASIIRVGYSQLEVYIPYNIQNSKLQVKVFAQLQEVLSSAILNLKEPEIQLVNNTYVGLGGNLDLSGVNFNPKHEFGEIYINGNLTNFTSKNNTMRVYVPYGPYRNFIINNITYKTAGLTNSFNVDIEIRSNSIMVDYSPGHQHPIFVHNKKAYSILTEDTSYPSGENFEYKLKEFTSENEKWVDKPSFQSTGNIRDVIYDGEQNVYLYKSIPENNRNILTILNMNDFSENEIELPFADIRINPTIISYQGDLFFFNGTNIDENRNFISNSYQRYKYIKKENKWIELLATDFDLITHSNNGKVSNYFLHNGRLYFDYQNKKTLRLNPDLTMNSYPFDLFFEYNNVIFGGNNNYNQYISDINKDCCNNSIAIDWGNFRYDIFSSHFTLNNEIYFSGKWFSGPNATNKLKKEILNELL